MGPSTIDLGAEAKQITLGVLPTILGSFQLTLSYRTRMEIDRTLQASNALESFHEVLQFLYLKTKNACSKIMQIGGDKNEYSALVIETIGDDGKYLRRRTFRFPLALQLHPTRMALPTRPFLATRSPTFPRAPAANRRYPRWFLRQTGKYRNSKRRGWSFSANCCDRFEIIL